jgi:hypothetical protein
MRSAASIVSPQVFPQPALVTIPPHVFIYRRKIGSGSILDPRCVCRSTPPSTGSASSTGSPTPPSQEAAVQARPPSHVTSSVCNLHRHCHDLRPQAPSAPVDPSLSGRRWMKGCCTGLAPSSLSRSPISRAIPMEFCTCFLALSCVSFFLFPYAQDQNDPSTFPGY